MNPEVPEFHTRPSTPVSPIPYHPPAPSKFPVLENQIDPVFNMTSTHTGSGNDMSLPTNSTTTHKDDGHDSSSSSIHSFSDPFEEQDEPQTNVAPHTVAPADGDADDDYAMTFDNDIEEAMKSPQSTSNEAEKAKPISSIPISISASNGAAPVPTGNTSQDPVVPPTTIHTASPVEATQAPASAAVTPPMKRYKASTPPPIYQSIQKGEIDIQQLLDNITANAERNAASSAVNAGSPTPPSHAGLPARPPVMPTPSMNPAYAPLGYPAGPSYPGPPGTTRASAFPMPPVAVGAPGTHTDPRNGLPPPPAASFSSPLISHPLPRGNAPHIPHQRAPEQARGHSVESVDDAGGINWNPDVQRRYEEFLAQERAHIASGDFDKFPMGSRLFIGNLPTEKVTKKDVFSIFHKYGRIAQISMKQAYGFVQFLETSSCYEALNREQSQELRGRKMHLEISKMSQKNKQNNQNHDHGKPNTQRRSRSPDRTRHNNRGPNDRNVQQNRNYERYDNRSPPYQRQQDYRQGPLRGRDDYRRTRSPTPPRGGYRGRDDYTRGHDYYDGSDRRRSRSRSPLYDNRRQHDRYRQRSPSPRRPPVDEDAALGIPRRVSGEVPDVQILLMEQLDRNFIQWVEAEIKKRGLKTEVMFLSPRVNEDAVIRRQILEGVTAVIKLTMCSQGASKVPLKVFDRSRGADSVRFDEYAELEPSIAAEVVIREKTKMVPVAQPQQPCYGQAPQQYGVQLPYQQPLQAQTAPAPAPNMANILGQVDNATLQKLLASMAPQPQQAPAPAPAPIPQPAAPQANGQVDLASLLGLLSKQAQPAPQQQQYAQPVQQQLDGQQNAPTQYAASQQLSAMLHSATAAKQAQVGQPQGAPPDVNNILAQLQRFRQ